MTRPFDCVIYVFFTVSTSIAIYVAMAAMDGMIEIHLGWANDIVVIPFGLQYFIPPLVISAVVNFFALPKIRRYRLFRDIEELDKALSRLSTRPLTMGESGSIDAAVEQRSQAIDEIMNAKRKKADEIIKELKDSRLRLEKIDHSKS